jgi:hypothetical protein
MFVCAAVLAALALYAFHITGDLYGDEWGHTYKVIATGSFWENIQDPSMCHPPLYFILAKFFYDIVGQPWAMRIPSLIFAAGTIVLVAFGARRMLGARFFAPAAWLAALSPFLLEFAAEGRAYAMLIFFSVATLWAFYKFLERESWKTMLLLAAAIICGALTHYFFWFEVAFISVYYLVGKRTITRYSIGVFIITFALLMPFAVMLFLIQKASFRGALQVYWSAAYFSSLNFLSRLYIAINYGYSTFTLPNLDPARNVPIIEVIKNNMAVFVLVLAAFSGFFAAAVGAFRALREKRRKLLFFALGILIPVALGLCAAWAGLFLIREKHLAIIWAPFFFLSLLLLDYMRERFWGKIAACAYLLVISVSLWHFLITPDDYTRMMNWTGMNGVIERQIKADDTVLYYIYDPRIQSAGGMASLDRSSHVLSIGLWNSANDENVLKNEAHRIEANARGRIFLVYNEADRNIVDPRNVVFNAFGEKRTVVPERFGRNLILYTFEKP